MSDLLKAYNVLGLEPGSDKQSVQARYKRLVLVWHPDRFPTDQGKADAEEELKRIVGAKDLLLKHFDGPRHKTSGCECGGGSGAGAASGASAASANAGRTAASAQASDTAAGAAKRQNPYMNADGSAPSREQMKRWAELEREFEYEVRADEIEVEKKAIEWFVQQKKEEKEAAEAKRRARRADKKKATIQDQLDAAKGGAAGKSAVLQEDTTVLATQQFVEDWKSIVLDPIGYFADMPLSGGLKEPAIFVAVIAAVNSIAWFFVMLKNPLNAAQFAGVAFLVQFGGSFLLAATTQRLSEYLGGSGDYESSYRACAYSFAPNIFLWIPIINAFSWMYSLFLFRLAVASAQDLRPVRCNVIVGLQVIVPVVILLIVWLTGVAKTITTIGPAVN